MGRSNRLGIEHQRHQRLAVERVRRLDAHQVEDGRQDINGSDLGGHPNALEVGARHPDDQRHAHGGIVDEIAVFLLAVVAEALAVVSNHHHDRVLRKPSLVEPIQEPADLGVGEGDLPIVEPALAASFKSGPVWLRRIVGFVGVVEVEPGKERPLVRLLEPLQTDVHNSVSRSLDSGQIELLVGRHLEVVVVALESLIQTPPLVDNESGDHRSAPVAGPRQPLGEGRLHIGQGDAAVKAHPVERRIKSSHDRRVRRQGKGGRRHRVLEEHTLRRQRVETRRLGGLISIAPDTIGPGGVEGYEENVGAGEVDFSWCPADGRGRGLLASKQRDRDPATKTTRFMFIEGPDPFQHPRKCGRG